MKIKNKNTKIYEFNCDHNYIINLEIKLIAHLLYIEDIQYAFYLQNEMKQAKEYISHI